MQKVDIQFPADDLVDLWDFTLLIAKSICPSLREAKGHTWIQHKLEPMPGTEFETRTPMSAQERQALIRLLPGLPSRAGMSKVDRQLFMDAFMSHPERPSWKPVFVTEEEVTANAFEILKIQEDYLLALQLEIDGGRIHAFNREHLPETRVGKSIFIGRDDALNFLKQRHLRVAEYVSRVSAASTSWSSPRSVGPKPTAARRPEQEEPAFTGEGSTPSVRDRTTPLSRNPTSTEPRTQAAPAERPSHIAVKRSAGAPVEQELHTMPLVILRRKQVEERTSLSRSAIYDRLDPNSPRHDATFPKQVKLGEFSVGWIEAEIDAWLASRIAKRR